MSLDIRPRLVVDLGAIKRNARALSARRPDAELMAVVKADAYGLGAERVVKALGEEGYRTFVVSYPEEARALYEALQGSVYYCLNAAPETGPYTERCRPIHYRVEDLANWQGGSCGVQVEIGIHRMGIRPEELNGLEPRREVGLVIAHMSHAGAPSAEENDQQRDLFAGLKEKLAPVFPKAMFGLSASGALLQEPGVAEESIRPGMAIFGGQAGELGPLEPAARFEAMILSVHDVKPGEAVGYNALWRAGGPSRIATLSAGYADGVPRRLSGQGAEVMVKGKRCPIVGAISMDLVTVDVTDHPQAEVGDWCELFGPSIPVDEVARKAGLIGYEVLTGIGERTRRIYEETSDR